MIPVFSGQPLSREVLYRSRQPQLPWPHPAFHALLTAKGFYFWVLVVFSPLDTWKMLLFLNQVSPQSFAHRWDLSIHFFCFNPTL